MRLTRLGRAQNLLHDIQAASETKPILASSSLRQRRAFVAALRDDIIAHSASIAQANRHDCDAFQRQLRLLSPTLSGLSGVGTVHTNVSMSGGGRSGGGGGPPWETAPSSWWVNDSTSTESGAEDSVPFGRRGVFSSAGPTASHTASPSPAEVDQSYGGLPRQDTVSSSSHPPSSPPHTPPLSATASSSLSSSSSPMFSSTGVSRAQHLAPLRLDKVCAGMEFLLQQPDPIAIPEGCWLHQRDSYPPPSAPVPVSGEQDAESDTQCRRGAGRRLRRCDPQIEAWELPVPLGLVGILSRYRPRMCVDAVAMGLLAGNAMLLDGGASVHCTNQAIMASVRRALVSAGLPLAAVVYVESYDVNHGRTLDWLKQSDRVDLGVVCGPPKLFQFASHHSTIPLLKASGRTRSLFVDQSASFDAALRIILNSKLQSVGAGNAATTLILHSGFPRYVELLTALRESGVALLGDYDTRERAPDQVPELASDEEFRGLSHGLRDYTRALCVKTVASLDQTIYFLELFGSRQCDGVIASDPVVINEYCRRVDTAVVMVNASTRLSSGPPLGSGVDLAMTVTKVHARGPLTLDALTTTKVVVRCKPEVSVGGALRK